MVTKKKPAAPKVPSAAKLKDLQAKLNKDKALRAKFVKDPGAVLSAQGVEITKAKSDQITKYLADMTAPQRAAFQAELVRVQVGIQVRVRIRVNIGITL
ncbi:MAG TPA: hypothetical protein VKB46_04505 [Pyrinomonadaceae bacterium]|nr:hypothetical protein [Pyrinomonadaceae bacterium]